MCVCVYQVLLPSCHTDSRKFLGFLRQVSVPELEFPTPCSDKGRQGEGAAVFSTLSPNCLPPPTPVRGNKTKQQQNQETNYPGMDLFVFPAFYDSKSKPSLHIHKPIFFFFLEKLKNSRSFCVSTCGREFKFRTCKLHGNFLLNRLTAHFYTSVEG